MKDIVKLFKIIDENLSFNPTDINKIIANYAVCCSNCNLYCLGQLSICRCDLKKKYIGPQDKYMNEHSLLQFNHGKKINTIEEIKTINSNRISFLFSEPNINYFKNFRLSNIDKIKSIEFECGGHTFDKIYKDIIKPLQYLYQMDDETTIPFYWSKYGMVKLEYERIYIHIEYQEDKEEKEEENVIFSYDSYDLTYNSLTDKLDNVVYNVQYTGEELNTTGYVKCSFNHPILYIMVKDYDEKQLKLKFDKKYDFQIPKITTIDNTSIYAINDYFEDYKNGINFSKIDYTYIEIDEKIKMANVYALGSQGFRAVSGMSGLAYLC